MKIHDFPQRIVLELTPACDLVCPMCPRHHIKTNDGFMSENLWRSMIDEIAAVSPQTIILPFWRGEPLLHPDFINLMNYAINKSLRIHISTNGHRAMDEYIPVLSCCEFVTFSVHTDAGYSHAVDFLARKKNGRADVQISFVKGEKSVDKFLKTLIMSPNLKGFNCVRLYDEHSKNGVFGKSEYKLETLRSFCPKLIDTLVIAYDGSISRCNHIWKIDAAINANTMNIRQIWRSAHLEQIRNSYPDNFCRPCGQWTGHTCGESWRIADGIIEHVTYGAAASY